MKEKVKKTRKQKRNERKRSRRAAVILSAALVLVLLISAGVLSYVLKIETVSVKGNFYSDRSTVIRKILPEEDDYRLYRVLLKSLFGVDTGSAFVSAKIAFTGFRSAEITVRETEALAEVMRGGNHVFLNEDGIVIGEGSGNADLLPEIRGLLILTVTELETLNVSDPDAYRDVLMLARVMKAAGIRPEVIEVSEGTLKAEFGDVEVRFGNNRMLSEKCAELSRQFPHFKGLKGIMHLEAYEESTSENRFYFEVLTDQ